MPLVLTNVAKQMMLENTIDASGSSDGAFSHCKIRLYTAGPTPGADAELSEYTACDFVGYSDSAELTFGSVYNNDQGESQSTSGVEQFEATSSATGNVVLGYLLYDDTISGSPVMAGEEFAEPQTVSQAGDAVVMAISLSIGAGEFGGAALLG